jgi:hypothetical protein
MGGDSSVFSAERLQAQAAAAIFRARLNVAQRQKAVWY